MPTIYHKKCVVCGNEYDTGIYNKIVCCNDCYDIRVKENRRNNKKPIDKKCVVCGKIFRADHGRINTCSDECMRQKKNKEWLKCKNKKRPLKEKACKICGKKFESRNNQKTTCSNKCRVENSKRNWGKKTAVKTMLVDAICPGCGKRHKKSIRSIDFGGVTPRYFCQKYPACMGKNNDYFAKTFHESWQYENRGYV